MDAIQKIALGDGNFIGAFRQNVVRVIGNYGYAKENDSYEDEIKERQEKMLTLIAENAEVGIYSEEYDSKYKKIAQEIESLKKQQMEMKTKEQCLENYEQRMRDMDIFLQNNSNKIQEFDNDLVRRLIESVRVLSDERLQIRFKSGICMEQEIKYW